MLECFNKIQGSIFSSIHEQVLFEVYGSKKFGLFGWQKERNVSADFTHMIIYSSSLIFLCNDCLVITYYVSKWLKHNTSNFDF